MATVVQQLDYIINILEDTRPAGEQVLYTISTTSIAKPIHREPNPDTVQFLSQDGEPTASVILDGTLKVHDLDGSPIVWVGTMDDFVSKMNNEYLNNSVASKEGIESDLKKLKGKANDLVQTLSYFDAASQIDRRVSTIVYSSAALSLTATETFVYGGSPGGYYVTSITLS